MPKKDNYFEYIQGFLGGGMENLLAQMDAHNKARRKADAGITRIDGFEGIERLNIPHKYDSIEIKHGYFYCYLDDTTTIYKSDGKFLFECLHVNCLNQGMFLVAKEPMSKERSSFKHALYNEDEQLTDFIFRHKGGLDSGFNKFGFAMAGLYDNFFKSVIINKSGEIVYEGDEVYLFDVIASTKEGYINLLTGNVICKKDYNSSIFTVEFMFVQTEPNCVYQINRSTGDFIIHGEEKKKEEPKEPEPTSVKQIEEKIKTPQRNEPCSCGSGKKFKKCCGK
jgi:hypothetical protein